ncbi:MAG: PAS domain-containing protein [Flavitalea sp.]
MITSTANNAPCGIFSFDDKGVLLEINRQAYTWLDYNTEDLIGQSLERIMTLPSRIFYQTHLYPLLVLQGHVEEIFITLLRRDESALPILLNAVKTASDKGTVYECAFIVVHHRKKFEDELVAARKEAQRALNENSVLASLTETLRVQTTQLDEQLAVTQRQHKELQQFSRVVNHDLQEPLRKISVFADLLNQNNLSEKQLQHHGRLMRST